MFPQKVRSYKAYAQYKPTSDSICSTDALVAPVLIYDAEEEAQGLVLVMERNLRALCMVVNKAFLLTTHVKWTSECKILIFDCEGEGFEVPCGVTVADYSSPIWVWYRGLCFPLINCLPLFANSDYKYNSLSLKFKICCIFRKHFCGRSC